VSACGVFDAFDGLVDPWRVGLKFGDLLLVAADGVDHVHDVGGGYDDDIFGYYQGLGDVVDEFELFVVLDRFLG
jgi:hypothetical protein